MISREDVKPGCIVKIYHYHFMILAINDNDRSSDFIVCQVLLLQKLIIYRHYDVFLEVDELIKRA